MPSVRQSPVVPLLIVFLGFVMGWFYNSQVDTTLNIEPVPINYQLGSLSNLEHITIDYSALASDQFRQLQVFGDLPVSAQADGKSNPFQ